MKRFLIFITFCIGMLPAQAALEDLTPIPSSITPGKGVFTPDTQTRYRIQTTDAQDLRELSALIESWGWGWQQATDRSTRNRLLVRLNPKANTLGEEAYRLRITDQQITIDARTAAGAYYALQSLHQIGGSTTPKSLPAVAIDDAPEFPYRGFMLDVCRHFRSKEFVMRQIDAMARLKLNRLHFHLTDGAGWRIEIKRYPRLTELGAWRPYDNYMEWFRGGRKFCTADNPKAQGGFYTQQDIREIVEYARQHHITVIPEIEMPAHSEAIIAAYPQLACNHTTGSGEFCAGKEEVFEVLTNILREVMELFPSEYIHIGGDEAGKEGWRKCPECQARMQAEKLENVEQLQSYFIQRIERFINASGRRMIGWDEILEGGLAPEATVMSWRGTKGGMEAVRAGHDAIMTPGEFCYIDHAQDAPFTQPQSIGGYLPLSRVYAYNPLSECNDAAEQAHILGVQANLWTEYIPTEEHCELMIWPRLIAIAEIGWSNPTDRNYEQFRQRALTFVKELQSEGYHPFDLAHEYGERPESLHPEEHLAVGRKVSYRKPYREQYAAGGEGALTDGVLGGWTYGDRRWQGFLDGVDVVIDLEKPTEVHYIGATFMQSTGPWVIMPDRVEISTSENGEHFTPIANRYKDTPASTDALLFRTFAFTGKVTTRYIRYRAWTETAERGWWLFTDEIVVY